MEKGVCKDGGVIRSLGTRMIEYAEQRHSIVENWFTFVVD